MRKSNLDKMIRGWFIGDFPRAVYRTTEFEVAVKSEKAGARVNKHFHKVASEITLVVRGIIRLNKKNFAKGDIIVIGPGEAVDYRVVKDAVTVIVKVPSVQKDKYYTERGK
ncbi:MAG: hypothetical protein WC329_03215 [Candidatus Omnitrophota bacterium]|nr:hypothetical protein [Candidatus Omnitrophota bacterium]